MLETSRNVNANFCVCLKGSSYVSGKTSLIGGVKGDCLEDVNEILVLSVFPAIFVPVRFYKEVLELFCWLMLNCLGSALKIPV